MFVQIVEGCNPIAWYHPKLIGSIFEVTPVKTKKNGPKGKIKSTIYIIKVNSEYNQKHYEFKKGAMVSGFITTDDAIEVPNPDLKEENKNGKRK
jgi:hypothetical protein